MTNPASPSIIQKLYSASHNLFWLSLWITGIFLVLLFPLRWLFGDAIRPVRMVSYVMPWLLLLSLPMLLIAAMRRRTWLSIILATATIANVFTIAPLFLPHQTVNASPDSFSLKIMSANQHGIAKIDGLVQVIREQNADIVLIQEVAPAIAAPSFHGLDDLYPYRVVDTKGFGQAIFSRYPLTLLGEENETGRTLKVSIETPAGPITVWNTHPIPPFLVPPQQFDAQIAALAQAISQQTGPFLVGGDFNATDQTAAYRKVHHYLADSYQETGNGFGFTYPAPPYTFMEMHLQTGPLWRIDYIFHSAEFTATSATTLTDAGGSDHFPILVELSLDK